MKKTIIFSIFLAFLFPSLFSQINYNWTTTKDGIFRDGVPFFLNGQSWSEKTEFTYEKGSIAETLVKQKLSELHNIGVNAIRIYGSPDDNDWDGSANYDLLIKWIEEWNAANPDMGNPNDAIYYYVQISPEDPQSTLTGNLPLNTTSSFNRAIYDVSNDRSVCNLVKKVNDISDGSKYLLGYLIYHEFNVSTKYINWFEAIGASGIEDFMNAAADAIHNTYAPGKLVAHTGDVKDLGNDIYKAIEALDTEPGNVFANFDMLGFNFYLSTDALLEKDSYYNRIINRRALSVNENRGWFVGETGASYDKEADPGSVAAANYTNPEGGANLQIMWEKTRELGNMIGFMMFTAQDNDKQETSNLNAMKQRGHFDYYGDKKFLYYIYPDIINQISTNERFHSTLSHNLGLKVEEDELNYNISFNFKNRTNTEKQFLFTIHSDDGTSKQRFTIEEEVKYITIGGNVDTFIYRTVTKPGGTKLVAVSANVIKEYFPSNAYLWGREHLLDDAIVTVAGLNLYTDNLPGGEYTFVEKSIAQEELVHSGLIFFNSNQLLKIPDGDWELSIYNLAGVLLHNENVRSGELLECDKLFPAEDLRLAIYRLIRL